MENVCKSAALAGILWLGCALLTGGCAPAAVTPMRMPASAYRPSPELAKRPVILDFKAGDRIPVSIQIDGEIIETTPSPSQIWLTAKRDFSVRIRGSEIKTSLDGIHFDQKPASPGTFQLGLGPTPEGGPKISLHVTTPVHGKP